MRVMLYHIANMCLWFYNGHLRDMIFFYIIESFLAILRVRFHCWLRQERKRNCMKRWWCTKYLSRYFAAVGVECTNTKMTVRWCQMSSTYSIEIILDNFSTARCFLAIIYIYSLVQKWNLFVVCLIKLHSKKLVSFYATNRVVIYLTFN